MGSLQHCFVGFARLPAHLETAQLDSVACRLSWPSPQACNRSRSELQRSRLLGENLATLKQSQLSNGSRQLIGCLCTRRVRERDDEMRCRRASLAGQLGRALEFALARQALAFPLPLLILLYSTTSRTRLQSYSAQLAHPLLPPLPQYSLNPPRRASLHGFPSSLRDSTRLGR